MMIEEHAYLEQAVLLALAGTPLKEVEQKYAANSAHLPTYVEAYRAAGLQALARVTSSDRWQYWRIPVVTSPTTHFSACENDLLSTVIGPLCARLVEEKHISRWWFMRKTDQGPHIRLRIFGQEPHLSKEGIPRVEEMLAELEEHKRIQHWTALTYEPETMLFGGPAAMELAHDLFYKDSNALYQWLAAERQGNTEADMAFRQHIRSEASLLLIQRFLRGTALDPFEQWDTWVKVTQLRPGSTNVSPTQRARNVTALTSLLTSSETQRQELFGDSLYSILSHWSEHFERAGATLTQLYRDGALQRGLRQVLATHIIFHWNRFNFGAARQVELARMAEISARY
jgi:thiopeptide-type bacteriocin biosynthesis protein